MSDDCISLLETAVLMYIVITAAFLTFGDNFWYTGADSELIGTAPPSLSSFVGLNYNLGQN
jgi:hypothetical protein